MSGFYKSFIILIIFGCCITETFAQNESLKIGDNTFYLDEIQKIIFPGENEDISFVLKDGTPAGFPFSTIYFTDDASSSVNSVHKSNSMEIYPSMVSDFLYIKGTEPIGRILIYDVTGTLTAEYNINDIQTALNLSNLKNGFYLVKTNNQTVKIIKK